MHWCIAIAVLAWTSNATAGPGDAQRYLERLRAEVATIETYLPAIAMEADRLAEAVLQNKMPTPSGAALRTELTVRPGALMSLGELDMPAARRATYWVDDWISGSDPATRAAAAWVLQCELFAALTRRGKVPVVRQSLEVDTRHRRLLRYLGQRFHHDRWLDPIEPGKLGRRYLRAIDRVLLDLATASLAPIEAVAGDGRETIDAGGRVFLKVGVGYAAHLTVDGLPEGVVRLGHDGSDPALPRPTAGDRVWAIGFGGEAYPGSAYWGNTWMLREAGAVAWVVPRANLRPGDLDPGDRLIDLQTPFDDALIKVPHYDARLGASTGVATAAVWEALSRELEMQPSPRARP